MIPPARIGVFFEEPGDYGSELGPLIVEREVRRRLPSARISFYSPRGWSRSTATRGGAIAEPLRTWGEARRRQLAATLDLAIVAGPLLTHDRSLLDAIEGLTIVWSAVDVRRDFDDVTKAWLRAALGKHPYLSVVDQASRERVESLGATREAEVVPDPVLLAGDLYPRCVLERRLRQLQAAGSYPRHGRPILVQGSALPELPAAVDVVAISASQEDDLVARSIRDRIGRGVYAVDSAATFPDVIAAVASASAFSGSSQALAATATGLGVPVLPPPDREDGDALSSSLERLGAHFDRIAAIAESCASRRSGAQVADRQRSEIAALTARTEVLEQALRALRERSAGERAIFAEAVNRFADGELQPAHLVSENARLLREWGDGRHGLFLAQQRAEEADGRADALERRHAEATLELARMATKLTETERQLETARHDAGVAAERLAALERTGLVRAAQWLQRVLARTGRR
jgi:hypothetical protein